MIIYPEVTSIVETYNDNIIVKIETNIQRRNDLFNTKKEFYCEDKDVLTILNRSINFTKQFYKECEQIKKYDKER